MITKRQEDLLNAIINEFIETAEAVGSINLQEKYNFKLSSATIRNEMAELVFRGYLYKKHSSAGRIPTTKAWRFFADRVKKDINYIDANDNSISDSVKEQVLSDLVKVKNEKTNLIRESLNFLSMLAENPAVALIDKDLYYSGLSLLPQIPELKNESDELKRILHILEDYYTLSEVFNKNNKDKDINIVIGEEETGYESFRNYTVIFSEIRIGENQRGFIAVIGPNRMKYQQIMSAVKYMTDTIKFIVKR